MEQRHQDRSRAFKNEKVGPTCTLENSVSQEKDQLWQEEGK